MADAPPECVLCHQDLRNEERYSYNPVVLTASVCQCIFCSRCVLFMQRNQTHHCPQCRGDVRGLLENIEDTTSEEVLRDIEDTRNWEDMREQEVIQKEAEDNTLNPYLSDGSIPFVVRGFLFNHGADDDVILARHLFTL